MINMIWLYRILVDAIVAIIGIMVRIRGIIPIWSQVSG